MNKKSTYNFKFPVYAQKDGWKYKFFFKFISLLMLLILVFGMEVSYIAQLDQSGSLLRNYWYECIKDREKPLMSYDEFLVNSYMENVVESLIIAFILWVAIVFIIDLTEDFIRFINKPKLYNKNLQLDLRDSLNIINLAID